MSLSMDSLPLWALAVWAVGAGPTLVSGLIKRMTPQWDRWNRSLLSLWLQALLLLLALPLLGLSMGEMGVMLPTWTQMLWIPLGGMILTVMAALLWALLMGRRDRGDSARNSLSEQRPLKLVALAATAGITEELIFRGVPVTALLLATGSIWPGAILSVAFFTWHHQGGWGWRWLPAVALMAGFMTWLYLHTGNLPVVMGVHALTDLLGFLSFALEKARQAPLGGAPPHR